MEFSTKKSKCNPNKGLDDSSLRSDGKALSVKRSKEIEKLLKPNLDKAFRELVFDVSSYKKA